ncbi:MAG: hypothetical protein LC641_05790 [Spirochaeta sp.]|nr:hypothetical protein [Spirochaeta sp.]
MDRKSRRPVLIILSLMIVPATVAVTALYPNEYDNYFSTTAFQLSTTTYPSEDYRSYLFRANPFVWHRNSDGLATGTVTQIYQDIQINSQRSQAFRELQLPEFEIGPGRLGLDLGLGRSSVSIPVSEIVRVEDRERPKELKLFGSFPNVPKWTRSPLPASCRSLRPASAGCRAHPCALLFASAQRLLRFESTGH